MKQKKKEEKLAARRADYDKNFTTDAGYTRPGSVNKSGGSAKRGKRR